MNWTETQQKSPIFPTAQLFFFKNLAGEPIQTSFLGTFFVTKEFNPIKEWSRQYTFL